MRLLLAGLLVAALAGCGGHGGTTTRSAPKPKTGIRVELTAQSHRPRVGKPWHYEVRVTDAAGRRIPARVHLVTDAAGRPVSARVHLQILFGGVPVGQIGRHRAASGVWRETIGTDGNPPFPARARGQALVFEAVVTARGRTVKAHYWIRVR